MTHTNHALHLPRRRGDKPKPLDLAQIGLTKEPTPAGAGINLGDGLDLKQIEYLPRRRGDKPIGDGVVRGLAKPTPHTRG